jgi:hypothetical protein
MKQTAVDWLIEKLHSHSGHIDILDVASLNKYWERAKQMEKEQIEQAYGDGINHDYSDLDIEFGIGSSDREYHTEKYYNQTYLYK